MPRKSVALKDWGTSAGVSSSKFAFDNRDILFGKLRPYFHKVGIAPVSGVCSTDIVVLKARMPTWSAFVLACVSSSRFVSYASQTSTGTRMPRTSWDTMSRYELCRPSDAIAAAFHQVVWPMLEQIVSNVQESRTLDRLRNALLPKLVSGELRVSVPISKWISRRAYTAREAGRMLTLAASHFRRRSDERGAVTTGPLGLRACATLNDSERPGSSRLQNLGRGA